MWRPREASQKTNTAAIAALREVRTEAEPGPRRVSSVIGSSIRITGNVVSHEDLRIEGVVSGPIAVENHRLTVGEGASVRGDVVAHTITIGGAVTGTVTAVERIEIQPTGRVEGDLKSPSIAMQDGAVIAGRVDTTTTASEARRLPIAS